MFRRQHNDQQNDNLKKKWKEKQLYGFFKQQISEISHE